VFHHIEEWSNNFSNDEDLLIPICDKCHRSIHGEGGTLFSKDELRGYKIAPNSSSLLSDKLPLGGKKSYAFFVGSNLVCHGANASLFGVSPGHNLLTDDMSSGSLMLTVLAEVKDGREVYLIQNNELIIDTTDVWDMHYSRSSIKIWRSVDGKNTVFIDLVIKPDVIILREMNTTFDGKPFRIFRFRKPQQRQLDKIRSKVRQYEELFFQESARIDGLPRISGEVDGIEVDALVKGTRKEQTKRWLEKKLEYDLRRELNWDWRYLRWILDQVLAESHVFAQSRRVAAHQPEAFEQLDAIIGAAQAKYQEELEVLKGTVAEYNGLIWLETVHAVLP